MKKINIRQLKYHIRHRYLTMNNIVIGVALVIGASWAWGSIGMMQRNFGLQKEIDDKLRQRLLTDLEVQTLAYEQRYYQSSEYQELALRERLGKANPGENALILPPNTQVAKDADKTTTQAQVVLPPESNFGQWANFLFGGNRQKESE